MVVRTRTKQTEYATAQVPASVWIAKPSHIDGTEDIGSVSEKIVSGRAFLKVVAYPWGVEFDVCAAEEGA